jgi:coniferyl-aldehyde dehydrogenase
MNAIAKIKGIYEQGRWNLSNLLRAPFRQPIDTILNMMLR